MPIPTAFATNPPEDLLIDELVTRINAGRTVLQYAARTTKAQTKFDVFPSVGLFLAYVDVQEKSESGNDEEFVAGDVQKNEQIQIVAQIFGRDQSEALRGMWELKAIIANHWPNIANINVMRPWNQIIGAIIGDIGSTDMEVLNTYWKLDWQYNQEVQ